jgi:hypothetical protein
MTDYLVIGGPLDGQVENVPPSSDGEYLRDVCLYDDDENVHIYRPCDEGHLHYIRTERAQPLGWAEAGLFGDEWERIPAAEVARGRPPPERGENDGELRQLA